MTFIEHLEKKPTQATVEELDSNKVSELKKQLQTTVVTNVFSEDEFRESFLIVFETIAKILSNTLGPYGATTMIDERSNYSVTKDGFHVLENLRFADMKQNRIHSTLFNISHQMVTKVGDGSTSAVVAAYYFLKMALEYADKYNLRPKDLNAAIQETVNDICDIITNNAIPVTEENLISVVKQIVNIATNENEVYTNMITDIYKKIGMNCTINIDNSETYEDQVIFEDGIYTFAAYLVDRIYHNKGDRSVFKHCDVLLFDHTLDTDIWPIVQVAFNKISFKSGKTLIVLAPSYEQYLMDKMRKDAEEMVRTYADRAKVPFRIIFLKVNGLHKPITKDMYMDLSSLLGATIYRPADTAELVKVVSDYEKVCREAFGKNEQPPDTPKELVDNLIAHVGYCEEANMGDKESSFKGFTNRNEALFNSLAHDAETHLNEEITRTISVNNIDGKLFDARTRYSKILCKSALIKVGGANNLERSINLDAVDDAVKACSSAIKYGYNKGCNMVIIEAASILANKYAKLADNETDGKKKKFYENKLNIAKAIIVAFNNVYLNILRNCFKDDQRIEEISEESINKGFIPFDLVDEDFDTDCKKIINSCRTDIEILKGAISMVGIVLTCNQYVSSTLNH